jgi:hypothetical protein
MNFARVNTAVHTVTVSDQAGGHGQADLTFDNGLTYPLGIGSLVNSGGAVLTTPRIYAIFYGNNSWNSGNIALYVDFFTNLGASNYMSNTRNELGGGAATFVKKVIVNAGHQKNDVDTTREHRNIINKHIEALSGVPDSQGIYSLITDEFKSKNLMSSKKEGYGTEWCGYHSYFPVGKVDVVYYVTGLGSPNCAWNLGEEYATPHFSSVPIGIDFSLNVIAHEITEAISDPLLNAWQDVSGSEAGDKCNSNPVVANVVDEESEPEGPVPIYNAQIGSEYYLIQTNYSQTSNTCPAVIW